MVFFSFYHQHNACFLLSKKSMKLGKPCGPGCTLLLRHTPTHKPSAGYTLPSLLQSYCNTLLPVIATSLTTNSTGNALKIYKHMFLTLIKTKTHSFQQNSYAEPLPELL
jgi:hypothetical protein